MSSPVSADERFLVGEIAIAINNKWHSDQEGAEALVVDVLRERAVSVYPGARETRPVATYLVEIDGKRYALEPHQLRKKRPPPNWESLCRLNEVPAETEGVSA